MHNWPISKIFLYYTLHRMEKKEEEGNGISTFERNPEGIVSFKICDKASLCVRQRVVDRLFLCVAVL